MKKLQNYRLSVPNIYWGVVFSYNLKSIMKVLHEVTYLNETTEVKIVGTSLSTKVKVPRQ